MAVLVALLALATAVLIGAATISRRPVLGVAAAALGIATIVCAYVAVKDYLPMILAAVLGLAALGVGSVVVGRLLRDR